MAKAKIDDASVSCSPKARIETSRPGKNGTYLPALFGLSNPLRGRDKSALVCAGHIRRRFNQPSESSGENPPANLPPRVSRVQLKLVVDGEVVDVIEKGDLLTVLEDRGESYLVRTFNGRKGVVAKVNAVAISESADIYTELIDAAPTNGRLYTLRAGAYWEQGKQTEALADFNRAIELGYNEPHAFVSRALFHAAIGDFDKAVVDYNVAIEKEPNNVSHYVNRAAVFMSLNKFEDAKGDYDKAIDLDNDNPSLYQQRAIAQKALLKLDESIKDFTKALELDPRSIPVLMGRGFVFFQMGQHENAVSDFGKVIELNPKAAVAFNNRGYNLQQLSKDNEALSDFDKAIELAPQYGLAHQNRAWLLSTTKSADLKNADRAVESATKACELSQYKNPGDLAALAAAHAHAPNLSLRRDGKRKLLGLLVKIRSHLRKQFSHFMRAKNPTMRELL